MTAHIEARRLSGVEPVPCECPSPRPDLSFPAQHFTRCPRFGAGRDGLPLIPDDETITDREEGQ